MAIFTPPYRPLQHQKPFVIRQLQRQRKRKRDDSNDDEDARPSSREPEARTSFHPVNKTDPYYVAGYAREEPLPPPPFPHAALKETNLPTRPIEDELAALNPPIYVAPTRDPEDSSTSSLRRRHLDNLTTILHRCMLNGDSPRAYRAWSLLVRTEIAGRGIDVRRNGRWSIGAELLIRKKSYDEGFKLARDYYERLIIQYPYTRSSMHTVNATAIYPALFNIWIFEVQDRSQRALQTLQTGRTDGSSDNSEADIENETASSTTERIKGNELEQALSIADRMDELLISPPYDSNAELKRLRRMVACWITDLYEEVNTNGNAHGDRALREQEKADNFSQK